MFDWGDRKTTPRWSKWYQHQRAMRPPHHHSPFRKNWRVKPPLFGTTQSSRNSGWLRNPAPVDPIISMNISTAWWFFVPWNFDFPFTWEWKNHPNCYSIIFRAEPWWNHQAADWNRSEIRKPPADAKADQRLPPLEAMEFCWENYPKGSVILP